MRRVLSRFHAMTAGLPAVTHTTQVSLIQCALLSRPSPARSAIHIAACNRTHVLFIRVCLDIAVVVGNLARWIASQQCEEG